MVGHGEVLNRDLESKLPRRICNVAQLRKAFDTNHYTISSIYTALQIIFKSYDDDYIKNTNNGKQKQDVYVKIEGMIGVKIEGKEKDDYGHDVDIINNYDTMALSTLILMEQYHEALEK